MNPRRWPRQRYRPVEEAPLLLAALAALPSLAGPAAPPRPTTYDPSRSLSPMVRAVAQAVVKIEIHGARTSASATQIVHESASPRLGEGSGFVVSEDGLVLTNHHVVAGASDIRVEFADGAVRRAHLVGGDVSIDVALLEVEDASALTWVSFGDSDGVQVGDWVVAMGNGLGLGTTVTAGIVSAKGRVLSQDALSREDYIQTDAAINQGNSGGPLFDLDGRVVGMSAAVITGANTVGFAIPSNVLSVVLADLRANGHVVRGFLGVLPQPLDATLRESHGVVAARGAWVAAVVDDTPAATAGLRVGDVVLAVDGTPVADDRQLLSIISYKRPGDRVRIDLERNCERRSLQVVLGEQGPR